MKKVVDACKLSCSVSILDGSETIRDYIAFPKNNSGRDVMIDAPAAIAPEQMKELFIATTFTGKE